jgi:hypothetical protein
LIDLNNYPVIIAYVLRNEPWSWDVTAQFIAFDHDSFGDLLESDHLKASRGLIVTPELRKTIFLHGVNYRNEVESAEIKEYVCLQFVPASSFTELGWSYNCSTLLVDIQSAVGQRFRRVESGACRVLPCLECIVQEYAEV